MKRNITVLILIILISLVIIQSIIEKGNVKNKECKIVKIQDTIQEKKKNTFSIIKSILIKSQINGFHSKRIRKRSPLYTLSQYTSFIVIDKPGYYELTQDIINCTYNIGICINTSNVILDGKGHILDGLNNTTSICGIFVFNATNITIKNLILHDWHVGIYICISGQNNIYNNIFQSRP